MTVRPITFTGPMVSALLEGRKTQTRRVLKPDTASDGFPGTMWPNYLNGERLGSLSGTPEICNLAKEGEPPLWSGPTQYAPGDLLYVRECWRTPESLDHLSPRQIAERCDELGYRGRWCPRVTEADGLAHQWSEEDGFRDDEPAGRLRAAMHMPRWASRLTLKVTDVRVERVQRISATDALAEGVSGSCRNLDTGEKAPDGNAAIMNFARLWDSINSKRGYGWDEDPWVIAISFEVIRQNVDELLKRDAA